MAAKYLIVAAKFNDMVTRSLLASAQDAFSEGGIPATNVDLIWVPGSFELAPLAAKAARTGKYSAIVCLGAVIRGETPHFDLVAGQAAAGCQKASVDTGVPIIFGVLTTDTVEQALNRAGLKLGNKGSDAANCALAMTKAMARLEELTSR
jgi:6,7-dimethyl-8-ribityllumazine synthase